MPNSQLRKKSQSANSRFSVKNSTDGDAKPNQLAIVSERKLKANRENAQKSTGPRTLRGKAFSRRNALKNGLFVREITDFEALFEDPTEYQELLNGLWDQYQPIGKAEEIEVERVAICYWKLKRAWRYENAVNLAARRDFVRAELNEQEEYCREKDKQEEALLVQLRDAEKEIDATGVLSQELKQRTFAMMPGFEALWSALEKHTEERMEEPDISKMLQKLSPAERSQLHSTCVVRNAIALVEWLSQRRSINVRETAIGSHAIPNDKALDRILRYEAAVNRDLGRTLDRLERLQRRRSGEVLPPPVNVRLSH